MADLHILGIVPEPGLFAFPPAVAPVPLPPAPAPASVMRPFNIPDRVYLAALDPLVPLAMAAAYAVAAKTLNKYNQAHHKRPWRISKTRPFFAFVVLHNIFLAVYSAWTFWGMLGVVRRSLASPLGPGGLAATADSLCRLHGPAGLGNSIYFNDTTGAWDTASPSTAAALLAAGESPSSAEMGRIWNEGLAYYGWIFYISKFYEVLDTFIILAKGKLSSTLQTYHHAGAMMCMWAGMRYMSVPIWVFCLFNSFIHALMYTYYSLSAFSIKIPMAMKRSLTTMQITQFIVGASCAMAHSFIVFVVPVATTDVSAARAGSSVPTAASALGSLKQLIFSGAADAADTAAAASPRVGLPTAAETSYIAQPCIATSSETFAIWLNVLYLAPLTYLFTSFFIASYAKRSTAAQKMKGKSSRQMSNNVALAEKAGWDAARDVEREVYGGEHMVDGNGSAIADDFSPQKQNGKRRRHV